MVFRRPPSPSRVLSIVVYIDDTAHVESLYSIVSALYQRGFTTEEIQNALRHYLNNNDFGVPAGWTRPGDL